MKKSTSVYIARVHDKNNNVYRAFFTLEDALDQCEKYVTQMTTFGYERHVVSLEKYIVRVPAGLTADEVYHKALLDLKSRKPIVYTTF